MVFSMLRTCHAMASLHVYQFDNKALAMLGQCWILQSSQTVVARPVPVFTCHFRPLGQDQHQRICSRLGSGSGFCFGLRFADAKEECGSSEHNPQTHGKVSPPALSTHRPVRTALRSSMPPQRRCSWRRRSTSFLIPSSPMQPSLGNSQNTGKELLLSTINNNEPQKTVD